MRSCVSYHPSFIKISYFNAEVAFFIGKTIAYLCFFGCAIECNAIYCLGNSSFTLIFSEIDIEIDQKLYCVDKVNDAKIRFSRRASWPTLSFPCYKSHITFELLLKKKKNLASYGKSMWRHLVS